MKKVLSIILSLLMIVCALPMASFAADGYTPADSYAAYDSEKIAANDAAYIDSLSVDQVAGVLLDYVDALLSGVDVNINYEGFELNTADMLDVDSLTNWAFEAINGKLLGGDFDNLDASALSGLSRKNGDVNYIYGIIKFMADNSDVFGKVFSWDNEEQTFDCGKIGEYLETIEEGQEGYAAREFYEKYILSNDIQSAFVYEIAREMGYTPKDGETFDEIISNGIIAWVSSLLQKAGLLSDKGAEALKAFDLRTQDIYAHLKNLVALLQDDNAQKEQTYFTYYLDSLLRTVLKTTFGFQPVIGEDAGSDVIAEFKSVYGDLALLYTISGGTVNYKAKDGSYYQFTVSDSDVVSAKAMTWENALGFNLEMPTVDIMTGDNDTVVGQYKPSSANPDDYKPTVYSKYADQVPAELKEQINVTSETIPEEYSNIIATAAPIAMKDYMKVLVKQGDETKLDTTISFAEVEAYAEQLATKTAKDAVSQASLPFGLTVDVESVDITLGYTGYATEDEFVCQVKADAKANLSGSTASYAQGIVDSAISGMLQEPIATIVMDNLSGTDSDISGLVEFANFLDTDFDVDMSVLDFAGNFDAYNGVIGQANRVLCSLLKMLLSDDGYESLALTEGGNENLTANLQKLCDKAGKLMAAAKNVISGDDFKQFVDNMNVSSIFASSHGFNADMIYNLDFSSVENLYVCALRMGCDMFVKDESGVLYDVHMLIENLDSLDAMAVAVTDYVLNKAVAKANDSIEGFNYAYTPYADGEVEAMFAASSDDAALAKDEIMTKLVDIAYYAVNDWGFDYVNKAINGCIKKLNDNVGKVIIPDVSFSFDVAKGDSWQSTLDAMTSRILELADGIIICVSSIDANASSISKIGTVANAILPLGSLLSNCAGNGVAVDFEYVLNDVLFGDVLDGDFDNFLRLFETSEKTDDVAKGVSVTYALIKASDHIVDAVFPNTVEAELYTESLTVQNEFTSSLSDSQIASRNMKSIDGVKTSLVPAILNLVKEANILPELVFADCAHENTIEVAAIPATCVSTGYTAGTRCTKCGKWLSGHEATTADAVHAGPIVNVDAKDATCTEDGYTAGTKCSACGTYLSGHEAIAATGHSFGQWKTVKAPTCAEEGKAERVCATCGATETKSIAKVEHSPVAVAGKAPTCTEDGLTDGVKCSVCGEILTAQEVIPATGHVDGDGNDVCDVCGATLRQPTFIEKIKAFFQRIIDWFKNLFK